MRGLATSLRQVVARRSAHSRPVTVMLPSGILRNITVDSRRPEPSPSISDPSSSSSSPPVSAASPSGSQNAEAGPSRLPSPPSATTPSTGPHSSPPSSSSIVSAMTDGDQPNAAKGKGPAGTVMTTLPAPPETAPTPPPRYQHPFDTHAFVTYLEKSELPPPIARGLMEAVREAIVRRGEKTREAMLGREDMENGAYLFRAALSELRTELSVRARNDGVALKAMAGAIRREVESLEQKMKEDIQTLRHDIEMDMNNRKSETRSELKGFDLAIEEINNKFTISLGDLRTEIESAKWDATRRAISIIVLIVVSAVCVSLFTGEDKAHVEPPKPTAAATIMRDMAVGTDDDHEAELEDPSVVEERLEKLLSESGVGKQVVATKKPTEKKKEIYVDRI